MEGLTAKQKKNLRKKLQRKRKRNQDKGDGEANESAIDDSEE
jgi:hypothetical protein